MKDLINQFWTAILSERVLREGVPSSRLSLSLGGFLFYLARRPLDTQPILSESRQASYVLVEGPAKRLAREKEKRCSAVALHDLII